MSIGDTKRYWWLKLPKDFFYSKRIKKLRKLGADFVIIYLKLQLLSLQNGGYLEYSGIEESLSDELALDIDEDADKVAMTISYLQKCGLLEVTEAKDFFLPFVAENTGSELGAAARMREKRSLAKRTINEQIGTSQEHCSPEKEIELDKELELDKESVKKATRFLPPTHEEAQTYINEKGYQVDAERFISYYESNGWMVGKNKMKDWKAAIRNWNARDEKKTNEKKYRRVEVVPEYKQKIDPSEAISREQLMEKIRKMNCNEEI